MHNKHKGRVDEIDKVISKRLKIRRVILRVSKKDIGQYLGVTIQQVRKYENATDRISSGRLFAIAKYLRVPVAYFYDEEDSAEYANKVTDIDISERELDSLIGAFGAIKNTQSKKKIIKLVIELINTTACMSTTTKNS